MTTTKPRPAFYLIRDTATGEDGYRYATLATEDDACTMSGGVASTQRIPPSRARRMAEAAEDRYVRVGSGYRRRGGYHLRITSEAAHALGMDCTDTACPTCWEA